VLAHRHWENPKREWPQKNAKNTKATDGTDFTEGGKTRRTEMKLEIEQKETKRTKNKGEALSSLRDLICKMECFTQR
jgi:hypothetical protein